MQQPTGPFEGTVDYDTVTERAQTIDLGNTPEDMRAGFRRLQLGDNPAPDHRPEVELGGVQCRLDGAMSLEGLEGRIAVWYHGGGYIFGSPATHARVAKQFAKALGFPVLTPSYRLAPEHPWPAQLDDGLAVVQELQQRGLDVLVAGDSAGGHLALNVALARGYQGKRVWGAALFSPNTDRSGLNPLRTALKDIDPIVNDFFDTKLAAMTFNESDYVATHPQVSPLRADLSVLPRTHIEVAGRELLLGDSTGLYAFAKTAGVDITLHMEPKAFHMWQLWTPWLQEGTASLQRAAEVFS